MTSRFMLLMRRKRKTYRLDTRIIEAMSNVAEAGGFKNPSEWLENHLFVTLQSTGHISTTERPLGETRGGGPKRKEQQNKGEIAND